MLTHSTLKAQQGAIGFSRLYSLYRLAVAKVTILLAIILLLIPLWRSKQFYIY